MNVTKEKFNQYRWYIIIGVTSFLVLAFFPFLGSELDLQLNIPNSVAGWIVFVISRLAVSGLNVIIFISFVNQAQLNIKDDETYKQALNVYNTHKKLHPKEPRSPHEYFKGIYLKKGATLFISSLLAMVGLGQAILSYDYIVLLSYAFVIVMAIIFGVMQMKQTEIFWTVEFPLWVKSNLDDIVKDETIK